MATAAVAADGADKDGAAVGAGLTWFPEAPEVVKHTASGGLLVKPKPETDYWRKTYYTPLLLKDNGHFLNKVMATDDDFVLETTFTLTPFRQFDQAGIMVRLSAEQWIKTGIEVVDGVPRVSCVVTNTFSDWSTQAWESNTLTMRLHRINVHDFVLEYKATSGKWMLMRIARLHPPAAGGAPKTKLMAGVFVNAPMKEASEFVTEFAAIKFTDGRLFDHDTSDTSKE